MSLEHHLGAQRATQLVQLRDFREHPSLATTPMMRNRTERLRGAIDASSSVAMPEVSQYDTARRSTTSTERVRARMESRRTARKRGDESTVRRPTTSMIDSEGRERTRTSSGTAGMIV
jgi:hypothetical protein